MKKITLYKKELFFGIVALILVIAVTIWFVSLIPSFGRTY